MEMTESLPDHDPESSERQSREYHLEDSNNIPLWTPHSSFDEAFIEVVGKAVTTCKSSQILPSGNGEKFDSSEETYDRLQNWVMSRGFAVVQRSKEKGNEDRGTFIRVRWQCIYHGEETANKRDLKNHVGRDEEGKIINQRKQEKTHVRGMSCKQGIGISWKGEKGTRAKEKTWILSITRTKYSHVMAPNPLLYIVHQQRRPKY